MRSMTCPLLVTGLLTLSAVSVHAQTLAEAAAATAKAKAAATAGPTKVYTNKDLPAVSAPSPLPATDNASPAVVIPSAPSSPSPPSVAKPGPTEAQLHDLKVTEARTTLRNAQQTLHDGERAQRELQQTYDNTCSGYQTLELIRPCADMRYSLRYTGPSTLSDLRTEIRKLARLLNLDPEAAVR